MLYIMMPSTVTNTSMHVQSHKISGSQPGVPLEPQNTISDLLCQTMQRQSTQHFVILTKKVTLFYLLLYLCSLEQSRE